MWLEIKQDVARHGRGGLRSWLSALTKLSFQVTLSYRFSSAVRKKPLGRVFSKLFNLYANLISGCYISERAKIAGGLYLPHPTGVVIGEDVVIGENSTIYQNVTLGSSNLKASAYPTLGQGVIVFANAVIIGRVNIGDRARIGAGAIVLKDVPAEQYAVGNPARIIKPREVVEAPPAQ